MIYTVLTMPLVVTQSKYNALVQFVDFASDGRAIESEVNSWIAARTEGKIAELLPEGLLTKDTVLVLLSAVYFKGEERAV